MSMMLKTAMSLSGMGVGMDTSRIPSSNKADRGMDSGHGEAEDASRTSDRSMALEVIIKAGACWCQPPWQHFKGVLMLKMWEHQLHKSTKLHGVV